MSERKNPSLQVGVLLLPPQQLLDAAAVDLLGMITPEYFRACQLPDAVIAQGREVSFHYIAESGAGTHADLTAGVKYLVTDSFESVGHLDILLIPGPYLSYVPSPAVLKFIRQKFEEVDTLFSVCSGIIPLVHSGLLKGKTATAPRPLLPLLREQFKDVKWEEKRWVRDGKIWSSGEITNGLDMMAAYIRETFPPEISTFVCEGADVGDRGQEYSK